MVPTLRLTTPRIDPCVTLALLLALALQPRAGLAQNQGSVAVSATVVAARAPRLTAQLTSTAAPPLARGAAVDVPGRSTMDASAGIVVSGNTGYRVAVRAMSAGGSAGGARVWVRDASGAYRLLEPGTEIVVRQGGADDSHPPPIEYRVTGPTVGGTPTPPAVAVEYIVTIDPST